jgi:glutamyl-Q tRNA(Asp) synthetase
VKRGRFAPSPTGPLHFGSLVAALASHCDARARGGEWLVRIEDVDGPRSRAGAADHILRTLTIYGFAWDGPVLKQSDRTTEYAAALQRLEAAGWLYDCGCSRQDLAHRPVGATGERIYPGTCSSGLPPGKHGRSKRIRVGDASIGFVDRVQGRHSQALARDAGDFVLRRADGLHAYHLAVVVDDAAQGITDVVRGADLLASTPRQILLQRRLGYPMPEYLHVPVALDAEGEKLSKQSGAPALPKTPLPTLVEAWAFLCQAPPDRKFATIGEFWSHAISAWDPMRIPASAALPCARKKD